MAKKNVDISQKPKRKPGLTEEEREDQLIRLATDRAEQQLRDGTASSQVICHYLKLGSTKEKQEREKMQEEIKLLRAKTEALEEAKNLEKVYTDAIKAMKTYSGSGGDDDYE